MSFELVNMLSIYVNYVKRAVPEKENCRIKKINFFHLFKKLNVRMNKRDFN